MGVPLAALCKQCSDSMALGDAGMNTIEAFWQKHSMTFNTDAVDSLLGMNIECHADRRRSLSATSTSSLEATESTHLIIPQRAAVYGAAAASQSTPMTGDKQKLFWRSHHVFSQLHQNELLRSSTVMQQFQGVMNQLREFSYEAIQNLDEGATNDLLTLLGQVEPLIGQMAGIAGGAPPPDAVEHVKNLAKNVPVYSLCGSGASSALSDAFSSLKTLVTCTDSDCRRTSGIELGFSFGLLLFFIILAIIYRNTCDPYMRQVRRMRRDHSA